MLNIYIYIYRSTKELNRCSVACNYLFSERGWNCIYSNLMNLFSKHPAFRTSINWGIQNIMSTHSPSSTRSIKCLSCHGIVILPLWGRWTLYRWNACFGAACRNDLRQYIAWGGLYSKVTEESEHTRFFLAWSIRAWSSVCSPSICQPPLSLSLSTHR